VQSLETLVQGQRPGFGLAQDFYRSAEVYQAELGRFLWRHWIAVGHVSEIPKRGDFFVFDGLDSSVIVLRTADGSIQALHNVCRHRGARLCGVSEGHLSLITCRYHGWTYRLNGELATWRHMPDGLDKGDYALRRCAVNVYEGIILISLDPAGAPDPAVMLRHVGPYWSRFELANCKVVSKRTWRLAANWKLAVENGLECYHCLACHPEYTAANAFVKSDEKVPENDVSQFSAYQAAWTAGLEGRIPLGKSEVIETGGQPVRAGTFPLAPGRLTGSQDGRPLAPLLGKVAAFDESVTTGCIGFTSYAVAMCDHALLITFVPQAADATLVVMKWLIREDARAGVDYDEARLRWLWENTTEQDKDLIELNAAGVATRGYVPGPYSTLESMAEDFVCRYLKLMAAGA
jgi:phenylpropionate dioxygenase-like ring-hydroxylating dioxygenase large terminal subunit